MAVPKIRFPGFTDDWEQRKLGDILQYEQPQKYIVSSTNYDDSFEIPVLTAGQTFILGYTNESEGVKEASPDKPVIIFDDFTTSSHYVDFPFKIKSSAMKLLTLTNERDNIYFAFEALQNLNYVPQNHERHWISIFSDFDISIPSYGEQQKIGALFKEIDSTITLHQRKLESMKLLKKSLLQKMFPKSGETVPEVRFPGFTDAWEQRKLGEISERVRGNDGRMDLPTLTISAGNGWMNQEDRFSGNIAGTEQKNYTLLKKGQLSYNHGNSKLAKYGAVFELRTYEEALVPRVYHSFKTTNEADPAFIEYLFASKLPDIELSKLISSGARMNGLLNINYDQFMGISIKLPAVEEQIRIGQFFRNVDYAITLHQRKVEALQKLKKSLLQQMFV